MAWKNSHVPCIFFQLQLQPYKTENLSLVGRKSVSVQMISHLNRERTIAQSLREHGNDLLENDVVAMEIKQVTMLSDFASVAPNDVTLIKLQHHNATKLQSI